VEQPGGALDRRGVDVDVQRVLAGNGGGRREDRRDGGAVEPHLLVLAPGVLEEQGGGLAVRARLPAREPLDRGQRGPRAAQVDDRLEHGADRALGGHPVEQTAGHCRTSSSKFWKSTCSSASGPVFWCTAEAPRARQAS